MEIYADNDIIKSHSTFQISVHVSNVIVKRFIIIIKKSIYNYCKYSFTLKPSNNQKYVNRTAGRLFDDI